MPLAACRSGELGLVRLVYGFCTGFLCVNVFVFRKNESYEQHSNSTANPRRDAQKEADALLFSFNSSTS